MLQAVVGDAHQPDPERDRWIPSTIDDAVEIGRCERLEERARPSIDGIDVLDAVLMTVATEVPA